MNNVKETTTPQFQEVVFHIHPRTQQPKLTTNPNPNLPVPPGITNTVLWFMMNDKLCPPVASVKDAKKPIADDRENIPPKMSAKQQQLTPFLVAQKNVRPYPQALKDKRPAAIQTNRPDIYTLSNKPKPINQKSYSYTKTPEKISNTMPAAPNMDRLSVQLANLYIACQQAKRVVDEAIRQEELKAKPSFRK